MTKSLVEVWPNSGDLLARPCCPPAFGDQDGSCQPERTGFL